jgi:acetylornithine deacetylase/succinyl-diaminopimelate desuccinylase family protein
MVTKAGAGNAEKAVAKAAGLQKKEMIRLLSKLISQDTSNPPGNEYLAANVVKEFFEKNGIRYRIFERENRRSNIIGYIGKGRPRLLIACHLDVVPAGRGWKTDPFRAELKGGKIYGRGAVDNKGPLAGALIAASFLKKHESLLKGQIILACVADEERGSECGMYYLLEGGRLNAEYAIVPDIEHELKKIDVAEKGLLFLKITSFGKQAHGSTPDKGINAVWNMLDFLEILRKYRMKYRKHPLLSKPTVNLGVIRGGEAPNIVPGECNIRIDIRYLPSQNSKDIIRDVKGMMSRVRKKNRKAKFRLEVTDDQKPVEVDGNNELVRLIKKHVAYVTGKHAELIGISGTTFVKPLARKGVKAIGFSPGKGLAHTSNEYISVSELLDFSRILCLVSFELLS